MKSWERGCFLPEEWSRKERQSRLLNATSKDQASPILNCTVDQAQQPVRARRMRLARSAQRAKSGWRRRRNNFCGGMRCSATVRGKSDEMTAAPRSSVTAVLQQRSSDRCYSGNVRHWGRQGRRWPAVATLTTSASQSASRHGSIQDRVIAEEGRQCGKLSTDFKKLRCIAISSRIA
jgi:hypothetical protein